MRKIHPELGEVLESLGAQEDDIAELVSFLVNQVSSIDDQISCLRNNAESASRQADSLEPEALRLRGMLLALTIEDEQEEQKEQEE